MNRIIMALAGLAVGVAAAACGSGAVSSASSAAAPVVSSSFSQAQLSSLETELTNALQVQVTAHPGHLSADVKVAVMQVFPQGDTAAIGNYAVSKFTPGVLTSSGPGSVRDVWVKAVVAFAVTSGGATGAPSLPPASIPGTSPSAGAS